MTHINYLSQKSELRLVLLVVETMANEQNLIGHGFHERTASEQREIARAGGVRSGEARREKKLIRERILERMGEADWDEYIDGIIARAKENKQDAEFLRDTIGQKPTEHIEADVSSVIRVTLDD